MITYVRTAVAQSGKSLELLAFAKEMAEIIGRVTGEKPSVATRFGHNANEVAWIMQADGVAQLEESFGKLAADADSYSYQASVGMASRQPFSSSTTTAASPTTCHRRPAARACCPTRLPGRNSL